MIVNRKYVSPLISRHYTSKSEGCVRPNCCWREAERATTFTDMFELMSPMIESKLTPGIRTKLGPRRKRGK